MFFPILGSRFLHAQGPPGPTGRRGEKVGHGLGVSPRYTRDCGRGDPGPLSPHVCP